MLVLEAQPGARLDRVAFSPDSRQVAAGCWDAAYSWTLDASDRVTSLPGEGVNCVAYLPDGRLIVGTYAAAMHVRRADNSIVLMGHTYRSRYIAVSPAAPVIVQVDLAIQTPQFRCFRVGDANLRRLWQTAADVPHTPTFTPDGGQVIVPYSRERNPDSPAPETCGLRLFDPKTGKWVRDITLTAALPHLVISPDGNGFVSPFENHIRSWDCGQKTGEVRQIENDSGAYITALAFHPSGRHLAATSNDRTVKLYDTATWQLEKTFTWDIGRMRSVAFSPDGTLAAAGSDSGKVVVWDVDV